MNIHDSPGPGVGLRARSGGIYQPIGSQAQNQRIDHLLMCLDPDTDGDFDIIIPRYQRGRVWTEEQSGWFVGFMLEGGRPPAIYLRIGSGSVDELVDGQQRLHALLGFAKGELHALLSDGRKLHWSDFSVVDRRAFMGLTVPVVNIHYRLSEADVLRIYLRLNRGGTPHTPEEIARVEAMLSGVDG